MSPDDTARSPQPSKTLDEIYREIDDDYPYSAIAPTSAASSGLDAARLQTGEDAVVVDRFIGAQRRAEARRRHLIAGIVVGIGGVGLVVASVMVTRHVGDVVKPPAGDTPTVSAPVPASAATGRAKPAAPKPVTAQLVATPDRARRATPERPAPRSGPRPDAGAVSGVDHRPVADGPSAPPAVPSPTVAPEPLVKTPVEPVAGRSEDNASAAARVPDADDPRTSRDVPVVRDDPPAPRPGTPVVSSRQPVQSEAP